jgi:aspartate aminotransferase
VIGKTTPSGSVLKTDSDVMLYLLEAARVAVLDGTPYGLSPFLRLSFATSDDVITEACNAIADAFAQLS